jgi:hypothetical protein
MRRTVDIPTPTLKGVLLIDFGLTNRLQEIVDTNDTFEMSFKLEQSLTIVVRTEKNSGKSTPMTIVKLTVSTSPGAAGTIPFTATATYHANFEGENLSESEWLEYAATPASRNVALQATVVCQRLFKEQLRAAGLPSEKIQFATLPFLPLVSSEQAAQAE